MNSSEVDDTSDVEQDCKILNLSQISVRCGI